MRRLGGGGAGDHVVAVNVLGKVVETERQRKLPVAGGKPVDGPAMERLRRYVDKIRVAAGLVQLRQSVEPVLQPIDSRELAIKRIEAPVLLVDDDDMFDVLFELQVERIGR